MKNFYSKLLITLLLSFLLVPILIEANGTPGVGPITIPNPLKAETFQELINSIINLLFTLSLVLAPIMIIIAGFYYLISSGDPEKIKTAKNIILYTVIGLIIIISAKGIMELFQIIFVNSPTT